MVWKFAFSLFTLLSAHQALAYSYSFCTMTQESNSERFDFIFYDNYGILNYQYLPTDSAVPIEGKLTLPIVWRNGDDLYFDGTNDDVKSARAIVFGFYYGNYRIAQLQFVSPKEVGKDMKSPIELICYDY